MKQRVELALDFPVPPDQAFVELVRREIEDAQGRARESLPDPLGLVPEPVKEAHREIHRRAGLAPAKIPETASRSNTKSSAPAPPPRDPAQAELRRATVEQRRSLVLAWLLVGASVPEIAKELGTITDVIYNDVSALRGFYGARNIHHLTAIVCCEMQLVDVERVKGKLGVAAA